MSLSLWRIHDLKPRIKIIKMRQVHCTEHLLCSVNGINFTNVVIFHKKFFNFSLLTAATFLLRYIFRSNHQRCSVTKGVLRNFAKFIGKHQCQSLLFNKVVGLMPAAFLKKRLWHRCFPMIIENFQITPF